MENKLNELLYGKEGADKLHQFHADIDYLNLKHKELLEKDDKIQNHWVFSYHNGLAQIGFKDDLLPPLIVYDIKELSEKYFPKIQ